MVERLPAIVPDTSVIIKWYRQEEVLATKALKLREDYRAGNVQLLAPELLAYEMANVLVFKSHLSYDEIQQAIHDLYGTELEWQSLTPSLLERACQLARQHRTTAYDAVFLALAESAGALLLTADAKLVRKLSSESRVMFLGDYTAEDLTNLRP